MSADALAEDLAALSGDPYRFVLWAFPWGEPGSDLERWEGPEDWQIQILIAIRDGLLTIEQAILLATASGHGVGKSALVAWIILWAISTFEDCRGVVTANTENQLKTKTWAELGKWHRLFIGSAMFKLTATALFQPERERTWRIDMVPWSERNTEAFAGLHNQGKRILIVYDEASRIADKVWEVSEGALTDKDTQIIWAVFGNPTRNIGRFKECFAGGKFASMWKTFQVDSRSVSFTNKDNFNRLIALHGEDSDYVRIRILGKFPRSGLLEFFRMDEVEAAMKREDAYVGPLEPMALGVDVARYGSNNSCIFPRKGRDARTTPREIFNGLSTVDLAQRVCQSITALHADGVFVDGGGVGGGVVDYIRHSQFHCFDIQFGGKPNNFGQAQGIAGERYANKRAEMYGATRAWITTGMIPDDPDLKSQFGAITYYFNNRDEIILTSKEDMAKEGLPSPDDLDALCLTFAFPLALRNQMGSPSRPGESLVVSDYNPFDAEHMAA